jgi:hypothetical protein
MNQLPSALDFGLLMARIRHAGRIRSMAPRNASKA